MSKKILPENAVQTAFWKSNQTDIARTTSVGDETIKRRITGYKKGTTYVTVRTIDDFNTTIRVDVVDDITTDVPKDITADGFGGWYNPRPQDTGITRRIARFVQMVAGQCVATRKNA